MRQICSVLQSAQNDHWESKWQTNNLFLTAVGTKWPLRVEVTDKQFVPCCSRHEMTTKSWSDRQTICYVLQSARNDHWESKWQTNNLFCPAVGTKCPMRVEVTNNLFRTAVGMKWPLRVEVTDKQFVPYCSRRQMPTESRSDRQTICSVLQSARNAHWESAPNTHWESKSMVHCSADKSWEVHGAL